MNIEHKIAVVINYCSNDKRFISKCIHQALLISDLVIVPVSTHLYGGEPENLEHIEELKQLFPQVTFKIFEWKPGQHPRYWHNMARLIGSKEVPDTYSWVLFLDADEILDDKLFNRFVSNSQFNNYDSYKLGCYWYFREPIYQAKSYEDSPVLIRTNLININPYDMISEREQMCEHLDARKQLKVLQEDKPMVHHYSWVRTKEEMLTKVKSWGHAPDQDWVTLVEQEFSRDFSGTDFVHGYQYNIVENIFNI